MKALLFALALAMLPQFSHGKTTAYLLTRYIAKEYCSCRFVVGQSAKVCKNENKATNIFVRLTEDTNKKVIKVRNIFTKAEARFISDKHGCTLVKIQEKAKSSAVN